MNTTLFFLNLPFFAEAEALSSIQSFDYWDQFVRMMMNLGILLALVLVTVWFLKKFMASRNRLLNRSASIQILERRMLSQKNCLYLIQLEKKKILISDSPSGPSFLCDVKPEESYEKDEEKISEDSPSPIPDKVKRFFIRNG